MYTIKWSYVAYVIPCDLYSSAAASARLGGFNAEVAIMRVFNTSNGLPIWLI